MQTNRFEQTRIPVNIEELRKNPKFLDFCLVSYENHLVDLVKYYFPAGNKVPLEIAEDRVREKAVELRKKNCVDRADYESRVIGMKKIGEFVSDKIFQTTGKKINAFADFDPEQGPLDMFSNPNFLNTWEQIQRAKKAKTENGEK